MVGHDLKMSATKKTRILSKKPGSVALKNKVATHARVICCCAV